MSSRYSVHLVLARSLSARPLQVGTKGYEPSKRDDFDPKAFGNPGVWLCSGSMVTIRIAIHSLFLFGL